MQTVGMTEPHERLRRARELAGYVTATAAAEAMGVPYGTYSTHENGSRGFDADQAARYAKFFKVRAEWLLLNKGGPKREAASLEERVDALPPEFQADFHRYLGYLEQQAELGRKTG